MRGMRKVMDGDRLVMGSGDGQSKGKEISLEMEGISVVVFVGSDDGRVFRKGKSGPSIKM